jgi:hypothetical protein
MADRTPPVISPTADIAPKLEFLIRETGGMEDAPAGAFKVKVFHTAAFPWEEVFKLLLYRGYKVNVTAHKADLFVEATT